VEPWENWLDPFKPIQANPLTYFSMPCVVRCFGASRREMA
jgi:hypothetical protein